MAENMELRLDGKIDDKDAYVHAAYENAIGYYRNASRSNKFSYKSYQFLTIFLSAFVTLTSTLSATAYVEAIPWLDTIFDIAVPIIAAQLTIIIVLSLSFNWRETWREMILNKERLERERDRFLTTDPQDRDYQQELRIINEMIIEETQAFFQTRGSST